MEPLLQTVAAALAGACPQGLCVGFSGGRDSTALLHALTQLQTGIPLRAVHVNHGLHPEAGAWADHCERTCRQWGVPCQVIPVVVDSGRAPHGLEAAAREARYAALRSNLAANECLLTEHHADDQLETVLMRLMRGGGPAAIAGIRPAAGFGSGRLLRPLLNARASQIVDYAQRHNLNWVEDPSNRDEGHDRNYIRHRIVPALKARWSAAADTATRTALLADEAATLLHELAALDAKGVVDEDTLQLDALQVLPAHRQRNLLRWFLQVNDIPPPSSAALAEGLGQLLAAREDAAPRLNWGGGELRRYRDRLYLLHCHPDREPVPAGREWDGTAPLDLGGLAGQLSVARPNLWSESGPLTVRFRTGGERLLQHGHHVRLKTLFQDGGVVPWMRPHVPLLFRGDDLLTVGDIWYAEGGPGQAMRALGLRWAPGQRLRSPAH
jgi:tRNA(Ile)-lysidine synthase